MKNAPGYKKLLQHLNGLSKPDRISFLSAIGTTEGSLRKAISTGQVISPERCAAIEKATQGAVTRRDLRPNDWASIWPELFDVLGKSPQLESIEEAA